MDSTTLSKVTPVFMSFCLTSQNANPIITRIAVTLAVSPKRLTRELGDGGTRVTSGGEPEEFDGSFGSCDNVIPAQ